MSTTQAALSVSVPRPLVIALHCSGGTGRQWRPLSEALHDKADVVAPDLIGAPGSEPWCGAGPFTLKDETPPILALVDCCADPVHLVGHSYGAAVALSVAAERPDRIASLSIYEPTTFSLLLEMGHQERAALAEICAVAQSVDEGLLSGAYANASGQFFDYWNGAGTWSTLKANVQSELVRYLPKACLDFRALFDNPIRLEAYGALQCPVLILEGEHAPAPTKFIAHHLRSAIGRARRAVIAGAGHMGPLTHAGEVAERIAEHIRATVHRSAEAVAA
jgi:pimeloyl-ACP methyl ester carboxylesterase